MIKINIDARTKAEIEKKFWEDANSSPTGLVNVLNTKDAKDILEKTCYKKIHDKLYNKNGIDLVEVKKLLLADRRELQEYICNFGNYSGNKSSGKLSKNESSDELSKNESSDELLKKIFRYDTYSKRKAAVEILNKLNVTVCPYCNRQYIFTLSKGHVRPQFDHYYPQNQYPYLALSLYNMIPSCSICNMAKSSLDTLNDAILYPFEEEMGDEARFEIKEKKRGNFARIVQGISSEFVIDINTTNAENEKIISTQVEKLHLDGLYNEHKDYVMDIIKSKYVNSKERIEELLREFPELFDSYEEVKNLLYMNHIQKEYWGNRPLSKLTHDIDWQLEEGTIEQK
jgi:hypothetical protein